MSMASPRIPCRVIRGGTSKGVFFHDTDLPPDPATRERVILSAFGAADRRQIDGLGGADPLTSKVAIVAPARHVAADVDYLCGQVGIGAETVDYSLNCGNLAAGAALFAVDEGLVPSDERGATVRIFNPSTGTLCVALVSAAVDPGDPASSGAAAVELRFPSAAGAATGKLLPTGAVVDRITLSGRRPMDVSIVDAGNVYAFVAAADLGLRGDEPPEQIECDSSVVAAAREVFRASSALVRERIPQRHGVAVRRLALVSSPLARVRGADLTARILTAEGRAHKAFAVTGAIATAFAAYLPNSVVRRMLSGDPQGAVRIAHPGGSLAVGVECTRHGDDLRPASAVLHRTARCLLDGWVHVPAAAFVSPHDERPPRGGWRGMSPCS